MMETDGSKTADEPAGVPDESTLRRLVDQLPLTVYVDRLDESSSNVYTSSRLQEELGYPLEQWQTNPDFWLEVVHPDDRERVLADQRRTVETGERSGIEYRMIASDGSVRWYLDQSTEAPTSGPSTGHAHGFLLDITERKELEFALQRERTRLESIL